MVDDLPRGLLLHADSHPAECIYKKNWQLPPSVVGGKGSRPTSQTYVNGSAPARAPLTADDDAKLVFGTVYSLRNMVRKLGGEDDRFVGI